ncbi:SGNH/GDSL hydrolase family protein [Lacinutrix neustonica]|uniref:SGNH/GDSL hydrolase family protein n=1 Tax=Lacinutrix neustonica TaxID=2980107 RepID=A0A9E8SCS3_9FLAO|nr:SGNH/GDSL hydrolase family protein [Lacinutrix neustonica]WAC01311.1 SGNH/GDSL hydrolase family protein [Lacinutrix neustonica]
MKNLNLMFACVLCLSLLNSCSKTDIESDSEISDNLTNTYLEETPNTLEIVIEEDETIIDNEAFKILSLGDSYTIGQSVCSTCNFPVQLQDSLTRNLDSIPFSVDIIAQTGWTTTNLINAVNTQAVYSNYDLVTLLIGVNNQYQNKPFELYETEFPLLLDKAIFLANGNKTNVIVLSIPDYAYTPFGNEDPQISEEIDTYNAFAENYCNQNEVKFVHITDITRQGIAQPNLVAPDGLHPSKIAYSRFVERLLPDVLPLVTN